MNEKKEQRVRRRRREDEQVTCWLAFAIIPLLQSKPERQGGTSGRRGWEVREVADSQESEILSPRFALCCRQCGCQG